MRCLITGATGFVGNRLAEALYARDFQVRALVRSPGKLSDSLYRKIDVFQGDILDATSIEQAIKDCNVVFHLAAFADTWSKDHMFPFQVNVNGTKNILNAALKAKVEKLIFTSTAGTLAVSGNSEPVDETASLPDVYQTDYELSKRQAEQLCAEYGKLGLNVVIVNPTRIFGPGLLNKSNSLTIIIKKYLTGKWRFLPGHGNYIGNYAFINDIVKGHILAFDKGIPGEKYILGGTNISFYELFKCLCRVSGKNYRLIHVPESLILAFAEFQLFFAEVFGKKPLITPPWVKRYLQNVPVSSQKAVDTLGYEITPIHSALEQTIQWLQSPA